MPFKLIKLQDSTSKESSKLITKLKFTKSNLVHEYSCHINIHNLSYGYSLKKRNGSLVCTKVAKTMDMILDKFGYFFFQQHICC